MNTLKFTNYDSNGKPLNVILKTNEGNKVLDYWPHTKYYDKQDKKYVSIKEFYKINNEVYV